MINFFAKIKDNRIFQFSVVIIIIFNAILIGATTYQYIVNEQQLLTVPQSNPGALFYPGSSQSRDLGIQVKLP